MVFALANPTDIATERLDLNLAAIRKNRETNPVSPQSVLVISSWRQHRSDDFIIDIYIYICIVYSRWIRPGIVGNLCQRCLRVRFRFCETPSPLASVARSTMCAPSAPASQFWIVLCRGVGSNATQLLSCSPILVRQHWRRLWRVLFVVTAALSLFSIVIDNFIRRRFWLGVSRRDNCWSFILQMKRTNFGRPCKRCAALQCLRCGCASIVLSHRIFAGFVWQPRAEAPWAYYFARPKCAGNRVGPTCSWPFNLGHRCADGGCKSK